MPVITLPEDLKRGVDNAFSNPLYRRIGRGQVDAVLTFENDENEKLRYVLEFKSFNRPNPLEFWKRFRKAEGNPIVLAFSGQRDNHAITRAVELRPASPDQTHEAAKLLGMSNYSLKLYPTPLDEETQQRVRVELTPRGTRPVYMALEAKASAGKPVHMVQGDIFRTEAPPSQARELGD